MILLSSKTPALVEMCLRMRQGGSIGYLLFLSSLFLPGKELINCGDVFEDETGREYRMHCHPFGYLLFLSSLFLPGKELINSVIIWNNKEVCLDEPSIVNFG